MISMLSFMILWFASSVAAFGVVYYVGLRLERWSPTLSLLYFLMLAPGVPIAGWLAAGRIVASGQAGCEEMDPTADGLEGMTPSEFRARCIATQDESEWLARRKL
jgi:hypothetical protein